ncbi:MAG: hypothetical protein GY754_25475 [bacterium]|nr:hypothetical protein [bacterium]
MINKKMIILQVCVCVSLLFNAGCSSVCCKFFISSCEFEKNALDNLKYENKNIIFLHKNPQPDDFMDFMVKYQYKDIVLTFDHQYKIMSVKQDTVVIKHRIRDFFVKRQISPNVTQVTNKESEIRRIMWNEYEKYYHEYITDLKGNVKVAYLINKKTKAREKVSFYKPGEPSYIDIRKKKSVNSKNAARLNQRPVHAVISTKKEIYFLNNDVKFLLINLKSNDSDVDITFRRYQ